MRAGKAATTDDEVALTLARLKLTKPTIGRFVEVVAVQRPNLNSALLL